MPAVPVLFLFHKNLSFSLQVITNPDDDDMPDRQRVPVPDQGFDCQGVCDVRGFIMNNNNIESMRMALELLHYTHDCVCVDDRVGFV